MKDQDLTSTSDEPPAGNSLQSLKQFRSAGRGFWHDVSDADWNDWRWQLKHRITTPEQLMRPSSFDSIVTVISVHGDSGV